MHDRSSFHYFVSKKGPFVVVAFIGEIRMDDVPQLEMCTKEILQAPGEYVILSFRDVEHVDRGVVISLARLQKCIRDEARFLRVASLKPDIKRLCITQGVVRHGELANNLQSAILSFKGEKIRQAA